MVPRCLVTMPVSRNPPIPGTIWPIWPISGVKQALARRDGGLAILRPVHLTPTDSSCRRALPRPSSFGWSTRRTRCIWFLAPAWHSGGCPQARAETYVRFPSGGGTGRGNAELSAAGARPFVADGDIAGGLLPESWTGPRAGGHRLPAALRTEGKVRLRGADAAAAQCGGAGVSTPAGDGPVGRGAPCRSGAAPGGGLRRFRRRRRDPGGRSGGRQDAPPARVRR